MGVVRSEAADLVRSLPGVHVDIGLITNTFEDLGFLHSTVLIEGEARPTVPNILEAFRGFGAQNVVKRDITIVYLSTHGYPINDELYFVTADSRTKSTFLLRPFSFFFLWQPLASLTYVRCRARNHPGGRGCHFFNRSSMTRVRGVWGRGGVSRLSQRNGTGHHAP